MFALVGQTYQTGANAWELFAIWSVCQLPLLLLLPNVASALLLVATTNIALFLFNNNNYENDVALSAVGLNLIFLLLSELFIHRLHDGNWRLLPKTLVFLVLVNLFFVKILTDFFPEEVSSDVYYFILFLQVALPSLAFIYFYKQYRVDFMNLITATVSLITAFGIFLFSHVNSADFAVLSGLLLFIITIGAIMQLHGWYKRHYPERKKYFLGVIYPAYFRYFYRHRYRTNLDLLSIKYFRSSYEFVGAKRYRTIYCLGDAFW